MGNPVFKLSNGKKKEIFFSLDTEKGITPLDLRVSDANGKIEANATLDGLVDALVEFQSTVKKNSDVTIKWGNSVLAGLKGDITQKIDSAKLVMVLHKVAIVNNWAKNDRTIVITNDDQDDVFVVRADGYDQGLAMVTVLPSERGNVMYEGEYVLRHGGSPILLKGKSIDKVFRDLKQEIAKYYAIDAVNDQSTLKSWEELAAA